MTPGSAQAAFPKLVDNKQSAIGNQPLQGIFPALYSLQAHHNILGSPNTAIPRY
jgi:hypothetical protein